MLILSIWGAGLKDGGEVISGSHELEDLTPFSVYVSALSYESPRNVPSHGSIIRARNQIERSKKNSSVPKPDELIMDACTSVTRALSASHHSSEPEKNKSLMRVYHF